MRRSDIARERATATGMPSTAPVSAEPNPPPLKAPASPPLKPTGTPESILAPPSSAKPRVAAKRTPFLFEKEEPFEIAKLEALYFNGPEIPQNVEFDFSQITREFLDKLDERGLPRNKERKFPPRTLLPENFAWRSATGVQRIPMLLAEFCAYKSALAYGDGDNSKDDDKAVAKNKAKEELRISKMLGGATDFRFFDTAGGVTDTQGFGCYYDGMIFISMRGTEGPKSADWDINLSSAFTDGLKSEHEDKINQLFSRFKAGKDWDQQKVTDYLADLAGLVNKLKDRPGLHVGFAMAWEDVSGQVRQYIEDMKVELKHVPPIVLTGHSLGGALATVGAYDLLRRNYPVAAVVTFGAPCVGNHEFSEGYKTYQYDGYSLADRTVRFVASGDVVPKALQRFYVRFVNQLTGDGVPFDNVGNFLEFKGAPQRSISSIESIITRRMEEKKKAEEERKKKEAEDAKKKAQAQKPAAAGADAGVKAANAGNTPKNGGTSNKALHVLAPILICAGLMFTAPTFSFGGVEIAQVESADRPVASQESAAAPSQAPAADTATDDIRVLIGIMVFFALVFVFAFVMHRLQSHSAADRYANFLSTLAYQKIRSLRADGDETFLERLAAANDDLERYLRFIRGDTGPEPSVAKMLNIMEAPARLKDGVRLDIYRSANKDANIF